MRTCSRLVALCLLLGAQSAVAQEPLTYTLTVTKVVEWNGMAPEGGTFEVCVAPAASPLSTVCADIAHGGSAEFPGLLAGDYVISEPGLGPEWDYVVGLPGDDPLSPDEVFVDDTVTVTANTEVIVRNSRLLEYAFVAIGDQILRVDLANLLGTGAPVLPDPEDPLAPFDTQVLYEAADTVFDGVTMAGDGNLYICGKNLTDGFVIRLMDPLDALPSEFPQLVFQHSATQFDPSCGTVDPFGGLVVANAYGGVLKFYEEPLPPAGYNDVQGGGVAGMCVFRDTLSPVPSAEAGLCWPDLPTLPALVGFPCPEPAEGLLPCEVPDSRDALVGLPSDVAYFYDNDLLVRTEVAPNGGDGPPGQSKKQPTAEGALLRVLWPDFDPEFDNSGYDGGFCDEVDGCDPLDCTQQNFKPLVSGLELAGEVTVSGNRIFVTDGKDLKVVVPPASPVEDCVDPVATTDTYASVSGNARIQVAAGDLDGKVYFGTRGSNAAGLYRTDGTDTVEIMAFSKSEYAAGIDGLAVTPTAREEVLAEVAANQIPQVPYPGALDRLEVGLDAMNFYLTADCLEDATVTEIPTLQTVAQRLIEDIPDNTDPNDPLANLANVAIPNSPPGLEGWQALVETQGCNVTDVPGVEEDLLLYEFWYSILLGNRRLARSDSNCSVDDIDGESPPECSSQFEAVLANSLFDPGVAFPDPIGGGGGKRSRRQVVGAALDPARAAFFFGYLSPLFTCLDPTGELCDVYTVTSTPATTVPIKFKLEYADENGEPTGEPLIGAVALATVARVANVPPTDPTYPGNPEDPNCPFPEFMQIEPNGAGYLGGELGLSPLFEGNQGNGNYSFNQLVQCDGPDSAVTSDDWCNGDYRITATFFSDNLEEQETLLRVTGCP